MTTQQELPGPLAGLRVVELTNAIGQWCGKLMADLGADVIKVEPPGGAEERQVGPFYRDEPHPDRSLYFWHYNTSKRGITLNLNHEAGREVFRHLVDSADLLLESMPPGHLESLGLGYGSLSADHPGLIMCSLTPFGQDGPWRDYKRHRPDPARGRRPDGGLRLLRGGRPRGDADRPGGGNAWHMGSHYAYIAALAAVRHQRITGQGQYIDVSVHEACALTTEMHMSTYIYTGQVARRQTGQHAGVTRRAPAQLPHRRAGPLPQRHGDHPDAAAARADRALDGQQGPGRRAHRPEVPGSAGHHRGGRRDLGPAQGLRRDAPAGRGLPRCAGRRPRLGRSARSRGGARGRALPRSRVLPGGSPSRARGDLQVPGRRGDLPEVAVADLASRAAARRAQRRGAIRDRRQRGAALVVAERREPPSDRGLRRAAPDAAAPYHPPIGLPIGCGRASL